MIIEGPGDVHSPIVGKANLMPEWFSEKCPFIQVKGPIQAGKYSRETASDWDSLFHLRNFVSDYQWKSLSKSWLPMTQRESEILGRMGALSKEVWSWGMLLDFQRRGIKIVFQMGCQ